MQYVVIEKQDCAIFLNAVEYWAFARRYGVCKTRIPRYARENHASASEDVLTKLASLKKLSGRSYALIINRVM